MEQVKMNLEEEVELEKTKLDLFVDGIAKGAGFMTGMWVAAVVLAVLTGGKK